MVNFERNTEDETHQSKIENPQNSPVNTNPDPMVRIQTRQEIENPLNSPGNTDLNLERNTEGETDQPNTTNPPSPPQQTTTTQQTTTGVEHVINVHGEGSPSKTSPPETEGPGDEKSGKGAEEDGKEEDQKLIIL
ncbi:hypothetical protein CKAN_01939700 [Cinnamomum micranthum f. kanehirae]|uniref:Uncharacterized protein n=1 Tax=Cinnamomum micranthum f. kanehirae TaxID=337451 RepID=A0A3S3N8J1_9MAGN|nr:hypothetical protein CKAN_01939700 [Cinnamomum micranthum f. kanehirae]